MLGRLAVGRNNSYKILYNLKVLLVWEIGGGGTRPTTDSAHLYRQTTIVMVYLFVYYCPLANMVFSFCLLLATVSDKYQKDVTSSQRVTTPIVCLPVGVVNLCGQTKSNLFLEN